MTTKTQQLELERTYVGTVVSATAGRTFKKQNVDGAWYVYKLHVETRQHDMLKCELVIQQNTCPVEVSDTIRFIPTRFDPKFSDYEINIININNNSVGPSKLNDESHTLPLDEDSSSDETELRRTALSAAATFSQYRQTIDEHGLFRLADEMLDWLKGSRPPF